MRFLLVLYLFTSTGHFVPCVGVLEGSAAVVTLPVTWHGMIFGCHMAINKWSCDIKTLRVSCAFNYLGDKLQGF